MSNKVYSQVAVWRATLVGKENVSGFEEFMKNELGSDIKYIKEIETLPTEAGPGGRNDVLFYVESNDVEKFATQRFKFNGEISWLEDVLNNESSEEYPLYPNLAEIVALRQW